MTEIIGWLSATILLITLGRQVYTQWRDRASVGISRWLFAGQIAASVGFVLYSALVANWVFVVTNVAILATAIVGQVVILANRRRESRRLAERVVDVGRRHFRAGRVTRSIGRSFAR